MDEVGSKIKKRLDKIDKIYKATKELEQKTGELLISLSEIDGKLNILFVLLCPSNCQKLADEILKETQSLDKRARILNLMMGIQGTEVEKSEWSRIYASINKNRRMRDAAAHHGSWFREDDVTGDVSVFLGPHLVGDKKKVETTLEQIKKSAAELRSVHPNLTSLIKAVAQRTGQWQESKSEE